MECNYWLARRGWMEATHTVSRTEVEHDHGVSDQQDGLCAHGQRTDVEQDRIDYL